MDCTDKTGLVLGGVLFSVKHEYTTLSRNVRIVCILILNPNGPYFPEQSGI